MSQLAVNLGRQKRQSCVPGEVPPSVLNPAAVHGHVPEGLCARLLFFSFGLLFLLTALNSFKAVPSGPC